MSLGAPLRMRSRASAGWPLAMNISQWLSKAQPIISGTRLTGSPATTSTPCYEGTQIPVTYPVSEPELVTGSGFLSTWREMISSSTSRKRCKTKETPSFDVRRLDVASLKFVAKTITKMRSICMEPTAVMFFQQALLMELVAGIDHSPLKRFINFRDQGRNQMGARYGAKTSRVDTIDLSSASDSVHVDLVRGIFPRHYLHPLLCTRTSRVLLPDGETVSVNKFAPMGSATCFPVQSIIFTLVVLLAYSRYQFGSDVDFSTWSISDIRRWVSEYIADDFVSNDSYFESIAVYGDDIICDCRCTDEVVSILERLGFSVNIRKSFVDRHPIRESCGIYSLNGEDVTPYSFKVKFFEGGHNAKSLVSLVSLANLAGDSGLRNLHSTLIHFILEWKPPKGEIASPIRFSSEPNDSFAIYSKAPRNAHLRRRSFWNYYAPGRVGVDIDSPTHLRYQREEVSCWQAVPENRGGTDKYRSDDPVLLNWDAYAYHMWHRAALLRGSSHDDIVVHAREDVRKNIRLRRGWTPTQ